MTVSGIGVHSFGCSGAQGSTFLLVWGSGFKGGGLGFS